MSLLDDNDNDNDAYEETESSGLAGKLVVAALVLVAGGATLWFLNRPDTEPESVPEAEVAEPAPAPVEAPPPKKPAPRRAETSSTGSVEITASEDGANVFLDGELVGPAPYTDAAVAIGQYALRVEKAGYRDYTEDIRVRPGKELRLRAELELIPPSLRVTSDVPGATVFVDRKYVGTTPVDIPDVAPGERQITVSAEGYEMYAGTVAVTTGRHDLAVDFKKAVREFRESVTVVHKHSFGNCEGTLVADATGIRYESDHKDAFSAPFGALERFEVDYIEKNMNLKLRKGKNYNFTEKSGNSDPLFVFHKNVTAYIDGM